MLAKYGYAEGVILNLPLQFPSCSLKAETHSLYSREQRAKRQFSINHLDSAILSGPSAPISISGRPARPDLSILLEVAYSSIYGFNREASSVGNSGAAQGTLIFQSY